VVAPLSTVQHWVREGDSWSNLNVLLYHGDANSRQVIRDYEWQRWQGKVGKERNIYKFNVLVSTYEVVIQDAALLGKIPWRALVVDEAHRIKNAESRLSKELVRFSFDHCLLLTGTPIQNNTMELFTLLHFLDPGM
jgi:SNF2 family DNA or RNA helicase